MQIEIIKEYKNPSNKFRMDTQEDNEHKTILSSKITNSLCGDEIELFIAINTSNTLTSSFDGCGCSLCIASASTLTNRINEGQYSDVQQLASLRPNDISMFDDYQEGESSRFKCINLAYEALNEIIKENK